MAAKEQAMSLEIIYAFQRSLKRKAYDSESDDSIDLTTNRGNKLKKKSRYVRKGQLSMAQGLASYGETVEHAGYERAILGRNPRLVDEDGYDIGSDDDDERIQNAAASAAEQNPYAGIQLDQLLAPLTSVTDIATHPSLGRPFLSKSLDQLAAQGCEWMHKENAALWNVKPLLTKLSGDHTWISCGFLANDQDAALFEDDSASRRGENGIAAEPNGGRSTPPMNGGAQQRSAGSGDKSNAGSPAESSSTAKAASRDDVDMEDAAPEEPSAPDAEKEQTQSEKVNGDAAEKSLPQDAEADKEEPAEDPDKTIDEPDGDQTKTAKAAEAEEANGGDDTIMADDEPDAPQGEATNGRTPKTNGSSQRTDDELSIHPLFVSNPSAHPDRDLGLPGQDAESVRHFLHLWVQKQEEVVRGTSKLYEGLLKANRLRQMVLRWSKAEAHVGEMSDGEDWYDKEYWGLTEDLKKGHDEEEEETQQTQKKTRNRRQ